MVVTATRQSSSSAPPSLSTAVLLPVVLGAVGIVAVVGAIVGTLSVNVFGEELVFTVVASKLTGVVTTPFTMTTTALLAIAPFAIAANAGVFTTMATTTLPQEADVLMMSPAFNEVPVSNPIRVPISTSARFTLSQST